MSDFSEVQSDCETEQHIDERAAERKIRDDLAEALEELYALIEDGVLVRDVSHDGEPGWALKQLPLVRSLGKAQGALLRARSDA